MKDWYIIIPIWFALLMGGQPSKVAPDVFAYGTTKGGRYAVSTDAVNYYSFDTLGKQLPIEQLPVDSFVVQTYTVGH